VKDCLRALELLDRAEGIADQRVLDPACHGVVRRYRELGIEAMRENAEWVAIYRQRPI
jgi:hypothetical protein